MNGGLILNALNSGRGSGIELVSKTFTENGEHFYPPQGKAWDDVTVKVKTYEDELADALARIAELEDEVEELEEQVEECDECKAAVIGKLQEYDPNFDPQTCEDIPPEIDKVVEENKGYTFPAGTDMVDISPLVPGDPIIDTTEGRGVLVTSVDTSGGDRPTLVFWYTDADGTAHWVNAWAGAGWYGDPAYVINSYYISNPTTGELTVNYSFRGTADVLVWQSNEWIGIGASGHQYKVINS